MRSVQSGAALSALILTVFLLPFLTGCEDPGLVGSDFTNANTTLRVDTLEVDGLTTIQTDNFSGQLFFFSAGQFSDPLFGDMTATALVKPSLPSATSDDVMDQDATMKLKLTIDQNRVYGDTSAAASFDLVRIDQIWRGRAWKISEPVSLTQEIVGSFNITDQDTIEVPLDDNWVQDYRDFFIREDAQRDSVYRIDFHGLAIVPRNNAKILAFERTSTEFIIENVQADTLSQGLNDWAYSLQRTNVPAAPAGTDILHSTLESIVQFDMDLTRESLGTVNISKVELVISQNRETLANTIGQVSTSAVRPALDGINLSLADPRDVPIVLSSSFALSSDSLTANDEVIRFNITTFTNSVLLSGVPEQQRFYLSLQPANGLIRSSLIYNSNAPPGKKPKLIVTSIQSE